MKKLTDFRKMVGKPEWIRTCIVSDDLKTCSLENLIVPKKKMYWWLKDLNDKRRITEKGKSVQFCF